MIVEAKRDDGALLVTDGDAAVVVVGDQAWVTPRDAVLARGNWVPASGPVPEAAAARQHDLEALRDQLAANPALPH